MSTADYPLITLHPVADEKHRWTGLLIRADGAQSGTNATRALVRLFGDFGLLESLDTLPCILPLSHPADLDPELAASLPVSQIVLSLPVAQCVDVTNAEAITQLASLGFRLIADGVPAADAVLPAAIQSLAVDSAHADNTSAASVWMKKLAGPHLALGVESDTGYTGACGTGFRWIAGNYPLHTVPPKSAAGNPGRTVMLKLLAQLSADAEARDIEITLKQDPHLSYQLLKLVNSVAFSLSSKISSFTQAIALLGRRQLQRWLQLLLYARPKGEGDAASPLMPRAAMRAGLMENLARSTGGTKDMQDKAFMVGMFSLVEPLIGLPAAEVIKPLNLNEDVALAITEHQGQLGAWLAAIETAEAGLPDQTRTALAAAAISLTTWATEQAGACRWAVQISREA